MSENKLTGAEIVIKALKDQGVDVIFGYPGGAVLPIYDALFKQNDLRHILVRHEQAAVHAAEGYARSTGKVGVVLVTSGPGATNAVTGLTDALMDCIPIVCLTGQVPTHLIGNDAFQEADTTGITRPCTKHNYLVKDVDDLARTMHEAFYVAKSGRPGPVVIDLPKDVQFAEGTYCPAGRGQAQDLPPAGQGRPVAGRAGGRADRQRQAADLLHRRRRDQFRPEGVQAADPVRPHDGLSQHQHADGSRRFPGVGQAVPRHAGHARHLRGQPRHARLRRDDQHRRAVRRPRHRQAVGVLARLARRSMSISIPARSTRTSGSTCRSSATARHVLEDMIRIWKAPPEAARSGGAEAVVGPDRRMARPRLPALQHDRSDHQAAIRAASGCRTDPQARHLHHHRSRPAPDVGGPVLQVRGAEPLDDLGRARHHGLRLAGRHRRADRPSGQRW